MFCDFKSKILMGQSQLKTKDKIDSEHKNEHENNSDEEKKETTDEKTEKKAKKKKMSREQRRVLEKRLHQRIHFGKTYYVLKTLRDIFEVELGDEFFSEECDACAWAKAKFGPRPKHSHRKATRVGERIHYDVFTSSVRTKEGVKYLLAVVDECSDFMWVFGMKKKSETSVLVKMIIKKIERKTNRKVEAYRCDNAGENDLGEDSGLEEEKTIPHTAYQNGKVERLGGVAWKGGQSFLYGGNGSFKARTC